MAVSETDRSQVSLEAEDLQSDPGQGGVAQEEGTNAVVMYIAGDPDWTSLSCLPSSNYIDYKKVIEQERLPAASPFTTMYAGVLYAEVTNGKSVYFEPQPRSDRSVMRVAGNVEGNDSVITFYPWDRVNFVYKVVEERDVGEGTYKCYIYTPANLKSYRLVVEGEKVHFEPTPRQGLKPNFTTVHMKQKTKDSSGDEKIKFGLYVDDTADGWTVKATSEKKLWTTFSIERFAPQRPPENVNWDLASSLDLRYRKVLKERIAALFQKISGDNVFVGALHDDCARIAYFESADPHKPRMRVAETKDVSDYGWDRINFVYYQVAAESSEYTFQIFTPANHGTYGLKATGEGELIFEKLPDGEELKEYFTKFQIKRGVSANPITTTTRNTTLGVYVDTRDGWKMKLTEKEEDWDKFSIAGHTLPSPEITATEEARSDS